MCFYRRLFFSLTRFEMLRNEDGPTSLNGSMGNGGKADKKSSKSKSKKSSKDHQRSSDADWTWKEQVDLVKFTKSPIQASLLQLDSNDLNKLALECFLSIMKYMGDYPMAKGQTEVDNVYTILMVITFMSFKMSYDVISLNIFCCKPFKELS